MMEPRPDGDRPNLTARIVDSLGRAIVTHSFDADRPFPVEAALCRQLGASRPVLREALKMLTAKGLLRARQRSGTIVQAEDQWNLLDPDVLRWMLERPFSSDLLIDFTQMRMAIEPRAAALAATAATAEQQAAMTRAIARMVAAERGEDDALEADIALHSAVLRASNNRFFRQFTGMSETTLRFSIGWTNARKGVALASAADHKRVVDAILAGSPTRAAAEMRDLIQGALDLMLADAGTLPNHRLGIAAPTN